RARPHPAGERGAVAAGRRAVQPGDRGAAGAERGDRQEPSARPLPQAGGDRPVGGDRRGPARGAVPVTAPPLELLASRGTDLLVRVVTVACAARELPELAGELAGLVVRSAEALAFCDVYVLDEDERALEGPSGPPVPLGDG